MEVIIIGAGGFSKQVVEGFETDGSMNIIGLVDDHVRGNVFGYPIIGNIDCVDGLLGSKNRRLFCGIGDMKFRHDVFNKFPPNLWVNCVSPDAIVSKYAMLGTGNYIGPTACVMQDAWIGNNNIIDCSSVISHDCLVGNHNLIASHSSLLGRVRISDRNLIGANSVILPDLTVGSDNKLGSGAVLTKSINDRLVLVGIPAKPLTKM